jgi:hypothetical protein
MCIRRYDMSSFLIMTNEQLSCDCNSDECQSTLDYVEQFTVQYGLTNGTHHVSSTIDIDEISTLLNIQVMSMS